jgi:uncharacterized protein YodC (DUF2158 family)
VNGKYKLGDRVELNSGGPCMTVASTRDAGSALPEYLCTWTDVDGQCWHQWFSEPTLKPWEQAAA